MLRPGPARGRRRGAGERPRVVGAVDLQHRHRRPGGPRRRRSGAPRPAAATARPTGSTPSSCARPRGSGSPTGTARPRRRSPRSPGQPGPDQARRIRSTRAPPSARSDRSGQRGSWKPSCVARDGPTLAAGIAQHRPAQRQRVRRPEHGQRAHQARLQRGDGPPDQPAPPVPDHVRPRLAERPDQPGDVPGQRPQVVAARVACPSRRSRAGRPPPPGTRGRPGRRAGAARPTRTAETRAAARPAARPRTRRRAAGSRWR